MSLPLSCPYFCSLSYFLTFQQCENFSEPDSLKSFAQDLKVLKNTVPFVFHAEGIGYSFGGANSEKSCTLYTASL